MKTNIMGTAVATVQQMQSYIQKVNPAVPKSVIDMVEYYISEGKTEGVRGDIAFAQSCLETGNFTFNGSAVTLDQNNFAGIGVTKNGMKGNSFSHPWIGIRAQIQHLKAYASNEKLYGVCVDPRFCYVKREIAPYVEWLGIQENPQGGGWAAGKNYGSKILEILAKIIAMPEVNKEDVTMNLNTSLISNNNSYANQVPKYIVIHNTDNFAKGATAKAHAKAQHDGNFSGYSAHVYVDDTEAYQATPFNRGAWHVGVNYGGGLFGICNNHNSIGIPIYQEVLNYNGRSNGMIKILLSKKLGEMRLTQADLARATGIRPNTINELYHELADRVNLEHLDLICEALDCELDELIVRVPNKESAITHTRQGTQKPGRKR